jgi:hypothetical protein
MTTGLLWLKNANCTSTVVGIAGGYLSWSNATLWLSGLSSGSCGLTDGSGLGQWQLPSIIDFQTACSGPEAVSLATSGQFNNIVGDVNEYYWTSDLGYDPHEFFLMFDMLHNSSVYEPLSNWGFLWPVRSYK